MIDGGSYLLYGTDKRIYWQGDTEGLSTIKSNKKYKPFYTGRLDRKRPFYLSLHSVLACTEAVRTKDAATYSLKAAKAIPLFDKKGALMAHAEIDGFLETIE